MLDNSYSNNFHYQINSINISFSYFIINPYSLSNFINNSINSVKGLEFHLLWHLL